MSDEIRSAAAVFGGFLVYALTMNATKMALGGEPVLRLVSALVAAVLAGVAASAIAPRDPTRHAGAVSFVLVTFACGGLLLANPMPMWVRAAWIPIGLVPLLIGIAWGKAKPASA